MKTETREVYKCDHCRKMYQVKSACEKHEPKCRKNPDNFQICFGCNFLRKKVITVYFDTFHGEGKRKQEILYCAKKKQGVHPYWIEGVLQEDMPNEEPNEKMPKECDKFESFSDYVGFNFFSD